jgi:zinc protease
MGWFHSFGCRAFAAAIAATLGVVRPAASQTATIRPLAYARTVLPNGLVVLLNEDHASPLVAVDVWYHIGSKDDKPGRTGMAHFCEHLMSEGSPNLDQAQARFYTSIGGTSPAWAQTTEDITHYYVVVPNNQLETVLWTESDRMAAPFSRADSARLAAVRGVIARERQQQIENIPFRVFQELTVAALFPPGHPYHNTNLPPVADLYSATVDDLRQSCAPYYVPNNAVLSISGDFETQTARTWVTTYFGGIAPGAPPSHADVTRPPLSSEKRLVLEDNRASQPELHVDWVGASYSSPDRLALNALGSALALNRFGRLSKLLVYDRRLAAGVSATNYDDEKTGVFEIVVLPRPGASMTTIETLVDSVLAGLATAPITPQELARFNSYNATTAVTALQSHMMRADTLAHDEIFAGDPVAYAKQVNRAHMLTPADVQRAAATYLTPGRVVMSLVPAGKLDLISKPDLSYTNVTPPSSTGAKPKS